MALGLTQSTRCWGLKQLQQCLVTRLREPMTGGLPGASGIFQFMLRLAAFPLRWKPRDRHFTQRLIKPVAGCLMSLLLSTTRPCGQPENACTCQSKGEKLLLHGTKLVLETTAILRNHVRHTLALQLISRPNQDTARKATRPPLSASSGPIS